MRAAHDPGQTAIHMRRRPLLAVAVVPVGAPLALRYGGPGLAPVLLVVVRRRRRGM